MNPREILLENRSKKYGIPIRKDARLSYMPGLPERLDAYADPVNLYYPTDTYENAINSFREFAETAFEEYHYTEQVNAQFAQQLGQYGISLEVAKFLTKRLDYSTFEVVALDKSDTDWRIAVGVVYSSSLKYDAQGHRVPDPTVVRDAAFEFMKNLNVYAGEGFMHQDFNKDISIVGSWFTPVEMTIAKKVVPANTWIMMFKVDDLNIWEGIKTGQYGGLSLGGRGLMRDSDPEETEEQ